MKVMNDPLTGDIDGRVGLSPEEASIIHTALSIYSIDYRNSKVVTNMVKQFNTISEFLNEPSNFQDKDLDIPN